MNTIIAKPISVCNTIQEYWPELAAALENRGLSICQAVELVRRALAAYSSVNGSGRTNMKVAHVVFGVALLAGVPYIQASVEVKRRLARQLGYKGRRIVYLSLKHANLLP